MPKLIAILAAVLVGAVIALVLCQVLSGREGIAGINGGRTVPYGRNSGEGKGKDTFYRDTEIGVALPEIVPK